MVGGVILSIIFNHLIKFNTFKNNVYHYISKIVLVETFAKMSGALKLLLLLLLVMNVEKSLFGLILRHFIFQHALYYTLLKANETVKVFYFCVFFSCIIFRNISI